MTGPLAPAEGAAFLGQVDEMLARLTGVDDLLLRRLVTAWKEAPPSDPRISSRRSPGETGQQS